MLAYRQVVKVQMKNNFGNRSLAWATSPLISVEATIRHPMASRKAKLRRGSTLKSAAAA